MGIWKSTRARLNAFMLSWDRSRYACHSPKLLPYLLSTLWDVSCAHEKPGKGFLTCLLISNFFHFVPGYSHSCSAPDQGNWGGVASILLSPSHKLCIQSCHKRTELQARAKGPRPALKDSRRILPAWFAAAPTWVADRVLIVIVREVGIGSSAAPSELEDNHAGSPNRFTQLVDIWRDDTQVFSDDWHALQLLSIDQALISFQTYPVVMQGGIALDFLTYLLKNVKKILSWSLLPYSVHCCLFFRFNSPIAYTRWRVWGWAYHGFTNVYAFASPASWRRPTCFSSHCKKTLPNALLRPQPW